MRSSLILAGLALGAAFVSPALSQTAGVIQFVAGDVQLVQPDGGERLARKGVAVNVGDTLATAKGAMAQLKMGDGAVVVVVPESRVTVAEFRFTGAEDGTEKVRYRLEQGGFRAVTGAIGRTHKKNYVIETPIAHMGVRGTDHETYYFPVTGPVFGEGAKPGAYNKVNTGRTFIRTGAGEVEIEPNQVGFVASANDVPVILPSVPGFFNRSIAPRNARPAGDSTPEATQVAKVEQTVNTSEGVNLVRGRGPQVEGGTGDGRLVGFAVRAGMSPSTFGRSGNGVAVAENGVPPVTGSAPYGVKWKSWPGGLVTVGGAATAGTTHQISSTQMTTALQLEAMPAMTTASYTRISGPAPTNGIGTPGAIQALNVDVNFSTQQITNYAIQASALANWNASGSGSIANFTGTNGIALNGTCSGCSPAGMSAASGTAHGAFVGPAAEGMITSFGLSAAGKSLSGAAYLAR